VGCGGARGALGCERGAAEAANGGEQDCSGALMMVVERRRKRGGEKKSRRALGHAARPRGVTGERGAAAGGRRRDVTASGGGGATWRLRAAAVRCGWAGKTPSGSGERRAGELEARWCG
jgi:hypothetical protein